MSTIPETWSGGHDALSHHSLFRFGSWDGAVGSLLNRISMLLRMHLRCSRELSLINRNRRVRAACYSAGSGFESLMAPCFRRSDHMRMIFKLHSVISKCSWTSTDHTLGVERQRASSIGSA